MKRYAIVRVDNRCPVEEEEDIYLIDRIKMFPCFNDKRLSCKNCRYGDTKEQLIRKVAQPLFHREIEIWYEHFPDEKPDKETTKTLYKNCLKQATKIIEFLGVKDD